MRCTSSAVHHRRPPTGSARGRRGRPAGADVRAEIARQAPRHCPTCACHWPARRGVARPCLFASGIGADASAQRMAGIRIGAFDLGARVALHGAAQRNDRRDRRSEGQRAFSRAPPACAQPRHAHAIALARVTENSSKNGARLGSSHLVEGVVAAAIRVDRCDAPLPLPGSNDALLPVPVRCPRPACRRCRRPDATRRSRRHSRTTASARSIRCRARPACSSSMRPALAPSSRVAAPPPAPRQSRPCSNCCKAPDCAIAT